MPRLCCPKCGKSDLVVQVKLAYAFDGHRFGEMRCDGPEENAEPSDLTLCNACEWTGTMAQLTVQPSPAEPCECDSGPTPGADWPYNGQAEVQRCDMCKRYPDDVAAAQAVVAKLNALALAGGTPETGSPWDEEGEGPFAVVLVSERSVPLLASTRGGTTYRILTVEKCTRLRKQLKEQA